MQYRGDIMPFFEHTTIEFGKNANSDRWYVRISFILIYTVLCSNKSELCVFRCAASVAHFFILKEIVLC